MSDEGRADDRRAREAASIRKAGAGLLRHAGGLPPALADLARATRGHAGPRRVLSGTPCPGLGDAAFTPLLARTEAAGVRIYIRPNVPSPAAVAVCPAGRGAALASLHAAGRRCFHAHATAHFVPLDHGNPGPARPTFGSFSAPESQGETRPGSAPDVAREREHDSRDSGPAESQRAGFLGCRP